LKTLLLTLFVLPAGLLASPATEVRVAVADFQSDFHVDQQIGGHGSGRALARILRADLAVLTPLTVVGPWDLKADAADVVRAVTRAPMKRLLAIALAVVSRAPGGFRVEVPLRMPSTTPNPRSQLN
jgi:hypothetical protein